MSEIDEHCPIAEAQRPPHLRPFSSLSGSNSFSVPANALRCFDVGYLEVWDEVTPTMNANPKARIIYRRKTSLGGPWQNISQTAFLPLITAPFVAGVNQEGYYQICVKGPSGSAASVSLSFDAPNACP